MHRMGPISVAAAGGVVLAAERHAEYGNMIDIDHDNGLTTRYAHLSSMSAKVGDVVLKGQRIGTLWAKPAVPPDHICASKCARTACRSIPTAFLRVVRARTRARAEIRAGS